MQLIDGRVVAQRIRGRIKMAMQESGIVPHLATIVVGDNPASQIYIRLKKKACKETGLRCTVFSFPDGVEQSAVEQCIDELNARTDIHGIIVQLPLPAHINTDAIIQRIHATKDVDGFHPDTLAAIERGDTTRLPVLVKTILALIGETNTVLEGKRVVLLSHSNVFVRPFKAVFEQRGSIFTTTENPVTDQTWSADILIAALGMPQCVTSSMVHDGAVLIDVGITKTSHGVVGDVDAESFVDRHGWLTPVPGGVGPVTVAMLLENTAIAAGVSFFAKKI